MRKLYIEIADNHASQAKGLMFRKSLPEYAGMLFKFTNPQKLKFWGSNTYIPLDIAFVSPKNIITKIGRIRPMDNTAVGSDEECTMAIEANDGFFSSQNIKVGDRIDLDEEDGAKIVVFCGDKKEYTIKDIFS